MTRFESSIPASYFDDLYAANPDPWRFAVSDYERDKYAATLQALPRFHYLAALEIGCSIGILTRMLAARCGSLVSLDVARAALDQAERRCADLDRVRFDLMRVPTDWPTGQFDLILLSEVVYYLDRADVARLASRVAAAAMPDGDIVLVHWLGETHYPLTGDGAVEAFVTAIGGSASVRFQARTDAYRLDVLRRTAA